MESAAPDRYSLSGQCSERGFRSLIFERNENRVRPILCQTPIYRLLVKALASMSTCHMDGFRDVIVAVYRVVPLPHWPAPFIMVDMPRQDEIYIVLQKKGLKVIRPAQFYLLTLIVFSCPVTVVPGWDLVRGLYAGRTRQDKFKWNGNKKIGWFSYYKTNQQNTQINSHSMVGIVQEVNQAETYLFEL